MHLALYDFKRAKKCYSGLAQLVEHLTVNQVVVGSSPTTGVEVSLSRNAGAFLFLFLFNVWLLVRDWMYWRPLACLVYWMASLEAGIIIFLMTGVHY